MFYSHNFKGTPPKFGGTRMITADTDRALAEISRRLKNGLGALVVLCGDDYFNYRPLMKSWTHTLADEGVLTKDDLKVYELLPILSSYVPASTSAKNLLQHAMNLDAAYIIDNLQQLDYNTSNTVAMLKTLHYNICENQCNALVVLNTTLLGLERLERVYPSITNDTIWLVTHPRSRYPEQYPDIENALHTANADTPQSQPDPAETPEPSYRETRTNDDDGQAEPHTDSTQSTHETEHSDTSTVDNSIFSDELSDMWYNKNQDLFQRELKEVNELLGGRARWIKWRTTPSKTLYCEIAFDYRLRFKLIYSYYYSNESPKIAVRFTDIPVEAYRRIIHSNRCHEVDHEEFGRVFIFDTDGPLDSPMSIRILKTILPIIY